MRPRLRFIIALGVLTQAGPAVGQTQCGLYQTPGNCPTNLGCIWTNNGCVSSVNGGVINGGIPGGMINGGIPGGVGGLGGSCSQPTFQSGEACPTAFGCMWMNNNCVPGSANNCQQFQALTACPLNQGCTWNGTGCVPGAGNACSLQQFQTSLACPTGNGCLWSNGRCVSDNNDVVCSLLPYQSMQGCPAQLGCQWTGMACNAMSTANAGAVCAQLQAQPQLCGTQPGCFWSGSGCVSTGLNCVGMPQAQCLSAATAQGLQACIFTTFCQNNPSASFTNPWFNGSATPLVLELDGPVRFTSAAVAFDLRGERTMGFLPRLGWIEPTAGFLGLDLNGNGLIDDGRELFGSGTRLPNGRRAVHGFEALAQYDGNHDGVIDARDPIFKRLVVWRNERGDGRARPGEVKSLAALGIEALSLAYHQIAPVPASGDAVVYESSYVLRDAHGRRLQKRLVDVYLRQVQDLASTPGGVAAAAGLQ